MEKRFNHDAARSESRPARIPVKSVRHHLVLCPINKFTDALEFIEYRVGGGSPNEGPLVSIVMSHVGVDLPHQFPDVAERAAANRLLGDKREPALDLVEPA